MEGRGSPLRTQRLEGTNAVRERFPVLSAGALFLRRWIGLTDRDGDRGRGPRSEAFLLEWESECLCAAQGAGSAAGVDAL